MDERVRHSPVLGVAVLVLASSAAPAAASPCPLARVTYDFSEGVSVAQSQRISTRPNALFVLLGHVQPVSTVRISGATSGRCVVRIDVRLHVRYRIDVAANFPKGSCRYRAVVAHERRHIAISRRAYASMSGEVRRAIAEKARVDASRGDWNGSAVHFVQRLLREGAARQDTRHRRFDAAERTRFADAVHACEFGRR